MCVYLLLGDIFADVQQAGIYGQYLLSSEDRFGIIAVPLAAVFQFRIIYVTDIHIQFDQLKFFISGDHNAEK